MPLLQATFGAGCFWGAEAFFREIDGVIDTRVGHSIGTDGTTPSARIEVVQVDFDSDKVRYEDLVAFFWRSHDPTSFDRQGSETGEAVRSAIFAHSDAQAISAANCRSEFDSVNPLPAITQIIPFRGLELAAEEHQRYIEKNIHHVCSTAD